MSSSQNYYRSIFNKFKNNIKSSSIDIKDIINSNLKVNDCESEIQKDNTIYSLFKGILKNKREAKNLRRIYEEMFEIFADKMRHIKDSTIRFYAHIICQFIIYSPSVDPNDVEGFIMFKFKLNKKSGILKSRLKGNALNYYKCINRFLAIIYSSEYSVLCPEFAKKCVLSDNSNEHLLSVLELTNAYVDLMNKNKFEDALILQLMYCLGANIDTIVLMTYDSIDEDQNITYFDTKNSEYVTSKLSDNLLRDIMFFKKISLENNLKVKWKYRPIKGKQILMGEFIISASAFAIYKRFERKFGGTLNSFNFTPE